MKYITQCTYTYRVNTHNIYILYLLGIYNIHGIIIMGVGCALLIFDVVFEILIGDTLSALIIFVYTVCTDVHMN